MVRIDDRQKIINSGQDRSSVLISLHQVSIFYEQLYEQVLILPSQISSFLPISQQQQTTYNLIISYPKQFKQIIINIMLTLLIFYTLITTALQDPSSHIIKKCTELSFLPMPKSIKCNLENNKMDIVKDPCNIVYILKTNSQDEDISHIIELIDDQQYKTFRCHTVHFEISSKQVELARYDIVVEIDLDDRSLSSAFTQKDQAYLLNITRHNVQLKAKHYVGFVRGLETFLQSITCNKRYKNCFMTSLPIEIEDEPLFQFRGILVDSSRHFIPMNILHETVDAMMYNKLNVFHWHVVDEDSFPLQLNSHPEFAEFASFSIYEKYSISQIKKFIHYAMVRGVRVIPEIDTPGHAYSWSFAPQNSKIACVENKSMYRGPLDVTLHRTYQIMTEVFKEIFELFPDPYVHLGGDEVVLSCLANKTDFIRLQNIKQEQIQLQYRKKQKKMLKQLNSTKKFIYWIHDDLLSIQADDIAHWWGKSKLVPPIKDSKIIISNSRPSGQFYIDMGSGGRYGGPYHSYATWLDMYKINLGKQIEGLENKQNILGPAITLWTQVSNLYTHHIKIWIRSSSIAERAWTDKDYEPKPDFLRRLTNHEQLMNRRGIPTAPATCQQCQIHPQFC